MIYVSNHETTLEIMLSEENQRLKTENARLRENLSAITKWLEHNQSDVFRRGLWDAIANEG